MREFACKLLLVISLLTVSLVHSQLKSESLEEEMMVRIAALEIHSEYLEEYMTILKEESEASVRLEPGVICIFPMFENEHPNQIRLLEIYRNEEAYQSHLKTPHFLKYKTSTLKMVKSLELIDMTTIDPSSMDWIFNKLDLTKKQ